jgi:putative tricarboxylic transport membrane protein
MSDRVSGSVILLFGLAVAAMASQFPAIAGQVVGPSVFPTAIGLGLAICGGVLALRSGAAVAAPVGGWRQRPRRLLDVGLVVFSLIFFAVALEPLCFLLTNLACLAALMLAFGARRQWILPVAVTVTLGMHYAFYTLLRVPLPWGVLTGLAW